MKPLSITETDAKKVEDTLRIVSKLLKSDMQVCSLDKDVMKSIEIIQNTLNGNDK